MTVCVCECVCVSMCLNMCVYVYLCVIEKEKEVEREKERKGQADRVRGEESVCLPVFFLVVGVCLCTRNIGVCVGLHYGLRILNSCKLGCNSYCVHSMLIL